MSTRCLERTPHVYWLTLAGSISGLIYGLILYLFPLQHYYAQPKQALALLIACPWATAFLGISAILVLFTSYALGISSVAAMRGYRHLPAVVVGFPLFFSMLLLPVSPITSSDLYDYLFRGWMLVHYHANTFVQTPTAFATDPLFRFVGWPHAVTAYGPLWEYMNWITVGLTTADLPSTNAILLLQLLFAYKQLAMLGFFLSGAVIWASLRRVAPEQQYVGLYLWLWNPLALWESVAAGHNDVWMALSIIVALWALHSINQVSLFANFWQRRGVRSRPRTVRATLARISIVLINSPLLAVAPSAMFTYSALRSTSGSLRLDTMAKRTQAHLLPALIAVFALAAGALIKYLPLFLIPVVAVAALRRLRTWWERRNFVIIGGFGCATLMLLAYVPFWAGWATLRNFSDRADISSISFLSILRTFLINQGFAPTADQQGIAMLGLGLFIAGVVWATWQAWCRPQHTTSILAWLLLWFIVLCNPAPRAWYMLWVLALVAIQPQHTRLVRITSGTCCLAMLSYVVTWLLPVL